MAFLHLTFSNFYFRDLGRSDLISFRVLGPTLKMTEIRKRDKTT